jgi:Papain family cysteine protease
MCSTYDSSGCQGGWPQTAYYYVRNAGGITYDNLYPYYIPAPNCDASKRDIAVTLVEHYEVWGEQKMIDYVLGGGTLAVVVDASDWGAYSSGIFSNCGPILRINHAVNIVGVNVPEGYWIIRNSWGSWWGDKGYMKLALVSI